MVKGPARGRPVAKVLAVEDRALVNFRHWPLAPAPHCYRALETDLVAMAADPASAMANGPVGVTESDQQILRSGATTCKIDFPRETSFAIRIVKTGRTTATRRAKTGRIATTTSTITTTIGTTVFGMATTAIGGITCGTITPR